MKEERNITYNKFFAHLTTILKHKHYVFKYMTKCGMPVQGLMHDMSKFSFTEFWNNVRYTEYGISPIDVQKKEIGFSPAWQHHKGRNPHHYEYWTDRYDDGCYIHRMPMRYLVECMCDYLAANKAYHGKDATYAQEMSWWENKKKTISMHPDDVKFLDTVFNLLYAMENSKSISSIEVNGSKINYVIEDEGSIFDSSFLKAIRSEILRESNYESCVPVRTHIISVDLDTNEEIEEEKSVEDTEE